MLFETERLFFREMTLEDTDTLALCEAAKACARFAKERGMKKIISYMKSDNLPSRHVAERNGMKFVKAFTKTVMGKVVEDEVLYMKDL